MSMHTWDQKMISFISLYLSLHQSLETSLSTEPEAKWVVGSKKAPEILLLSLSDLPQSIGVIDTLP